MKVARNSDDLLILGDSPWSTGIGLIIFVIILVFGGMMLWQNAPWIASFLFVIAAVVGFIGFTVFVNRVQVIFLRPDNKILIQRRPIFGSSSKEHSLDHLVGAVVEEKSTSGTQILYRPTLVFDVDGTEERIPIVEVYSNESGVQVMVETVNEWLPARGGSSP